jgi:hypothetical protein
MVLSDMLRIRLDETLKYQPLYRTWIGHVPEVNLIKPEHIEVLSDHDVKTLLSMATIVHHCYILVIVSDTTQQQ